jgi:DNA-binding SARP family transcriptional activator
MTRWHTRRGLRFVLAVGMLVALVAIRPPLPRPSGLSAPLATGDLTDVAVLALWGVAVVGTLGVALRAIASRGPRRRSNSGRSTASNAAPRRPRAAPSVTGVRLAGTEPYLGVTATGSRAAATGLPAGSMPSSNGRGGSDDVPQIRISLLGPFQLDAPSGKRIKRTATRDLIAYLALHPHGASRDELLEALWPGGDPRRTRARLWQSITEARQVVGGDALRRQGDRYALDHKLISVDVERLADCLAELEANSAPKDALLIDACSIVRGTPLEGLDAIWADPHRPRLATAATELLLHVGRAAVAAHRPRLALQAAEQGLRLDDLNEALWQIAMRAHADLGARTAVTESYERLAATCDQDLGVKPSRETQMLYRALLAQDAETAGR